MAKFVRGTISPELDKECESLKRRLMAKGVSERLLTRPKLQEILLSERALNFRNLSMERVMVILGR